MCRAAVSGFFPLPMRFEVAEEITKARRMEIIRSLGSTKCESCSGPKPARRSHCGFCFRRLPMRLQKALYRPFGQGYEEAFEESLSSLKGAGAEG